MNALMKALTVAVALCAASEVSAATYTFDAHGGTGVGVDLGPVGGFENGLTLTSNNNGTPNIFSTLTAVAANSIEVTGQWIYSSFDVDGSALDPFGYFVNGVFTQLTVALPVPAFQQGAFSFIVNAGQEYGFYTVALDGILGSSSATVYVNTAAVPVPAAGLMLVGALGGMAALRRRKQIAA
jgi:hypothetical protein